MDTYMDTYAYYPGTEALAKGEMRITACGTGMPAARLGQAATCWLVELGNGDKFLFDLGTGSMANIAAYMIPCSRPWFIESSHNTWRTSGQLITDREEGEIA